MKIPKQLINLKFCRIKKKSKVPIEKDWVNKPYSYEEIQKFKDENYGVLCGYHHLAVIDCDKESLKLVVAQLLPNTFSVKTGGGGTHFYYFIPDLKQKIILNLDEEHLGEIQFKGQQVVGVGSTHPNGKTYDIINNVGIETISMEELKKVLGNFMEKTQVVLEDKEDVKDYKNLISEIVKVWKEGDRQELALSVSGYLRKEKRLGINKVKSIIKEVCEITDDEELKMRLRAVDETFKKDESKIRGIKGLGKVKDKDGKTLDKEGISIDKLADYLMEKYTFKTIYGTTTERIYLYDKGIYVLKGRETIKTEVENILKAKARTGVVNEVFEKIKRKTPVSLEEFHTLPKGLVCLENGIYDLKQKKFMKHSPEYYFKLKLPIFYNPIAKCPKNEEFFKEMLYEEDFPLMQEWFGYNLYNVYFEKKAVIFFGETDTGKTMAIGVLCAFIGEQNKVSLSLQNISYGKTFDLLDLKDKFSNIHDDLSSKDVNDTGGFKIATGGGTITGEEKFGDRIQFKTFAKLTFATNDIPATKQIDDTAYYNRWIPMAFDNQIKESEQDKFLLEKLTTKEEISGLFNWAVEGLHRLLKNNGFSFNKTTEEIKQIMQRSSHPLSAFAQDCLIQENGNVITKETMYKVYSEWCQMSQKARFTKEKLGRNLERFVPYLIDTRKKERGWLNVKFSDKIKNLKGGFDTNDTLQ